MSEPAAVNPFVNFAREWGPVFLMSILLMLVMMLWIGCTQHPENGEPGRFQMLLDKEGQVIVLDTATGETWVRSQHSKKPLP